MKVRVYESADGRALYTNFRDGSRRRVLVDPDTGNVTLRKRPRKARRAEKKRRRRER